MTTRNEIFNSIKISGLTFENPVSDTVDSLTAGKYPSQNSVLTITDATGTAKFLRSIAVDTVEVQNIVADVGLFIDVSAGTLTSTNLNATNITAGSVTSTGSITATSLRLTDGTSGVLSMNNSGTPLWNSQSLLGWQTLLAPSTMIPLLPPTATASDIANTVNSLLTALKNKGIMIS
jgi:hypothetical protein